jgi:hypothetical protein
MDYDREKTAELALALLYLNTFDDSFGVRAWKNIAWEVLDYLYDKGYITDPKTKSKSVAVSEEGLEAAKAMFEKYCKP